MSAYEAALEALKEHAKAIAGFDLRDAFAKDRDRFARYSASLDDLLLDYSKCAVTEETLDHLVKLAQAAGLAERREEMFSGKHINMTEDRAVLHTALRAGADSAIKVDGQDISRDVEAVLQAMSKFAEAVRSGSKVKTGVRTR